MKHPHVDWIMEILNNPPKPIKKDGLWVMDSNRRLMVVEYREDKPMMQRELTPHLLVALCKEVIRLKKINMKNNFDIKDNIIELLKEDLECVHQYLDDLKLSRKDEQGKEYSIVGRIKQLEVKHLKELSNIESFYLNKL